MQATYTEAELVAGCVRNERFWQERFYRQFYPTMLRMCKRYTKDPEEAMHILNGGMLRVFQKLETYEARGSLEGWVRRLVFHAVSDHFRKTNKDLHFLNLEDRDAPINLSALDNLYADDILREVEELPPASKQVFVLYALEGYSHREIAEKMSISEGTSKWHLNNARKILKERLSNEENTKRYAK